MVPLVLVQVQVLVLAQVLVPAQVPVRAQVLELASVSSWSSLRRRPCWHPDTGHRRRCYYRRSNRLQCVLSRWCSNRNEPAWYQ
jgi:hypothetical protein